MATGGQVVVDALRRQGVRQVFGVPGESFLPILDALADTVGGVDFVSCRYEGGAVFMAEALGKLTARPGVALVTRGPGACNGSIGVHTAAQDSTPLVLLVGQVPTRWRGREAFQEVDYDRMFAPLAKWVAEAQTADELPALLEEAFTVAVSGRPGPVVLALPEDVLSGAVTAAATESPVVDGVTPRAEDIAALFGLLDRAEQPLVIVGGGGWDAGAVAALRAFVAESGLPVGTSFRCQDLIDNRSPQFAGDVGININPRLRQRIRDADLVLAVGCRLGEMTTQGYSLFDGARADQTLVHVHVDASEFGRVFAAGLAIHADVGSFAGAMRARTAGGGAAWAGWTAAARADYEAWVRAGECPGALDMAVVVRTMRDRLADDAIVTNDAGNFSGWLSRYFEYRNFRTQLGPTNGAMGYAVPAAVAAKAADPTRQVVAVVGDGGTLMTGQEIATAAQYGLDPVVLIVDNSMYGTIRMHQERAYPGRVIGSDLDNPDFVAWARSFGAMAERVAATEEFDGAFAAALGAGRPAVLVLELDREAISTTATLSGIRARALAG